MQILLNYLAPAMIAISLLGELAGSVHIFVIQNQSVLKEKDNDALFRFAIAYLLATLMPFLVFLLNFLTMDFDILSIIFFLIIAPLLTIGLSVYIFLFFLPKRYQRKRLFIFYGLSPAVLFVTMIIWGVAGWMQSPLDTY